MAEKKEKDILTRLTEATTQRESVRLPDDLERQCAGIFKKYDHLGIELLDRGCFAQAFREVYYERGRRVTSGYTVSFVQNMFFRSKDPV